MVDKRPFVDRRIGYLVLLQGDRVDNIDEIAEDVNNSLQSDLDFRKVITTKDHPPQFKIVTGRSSTSTTRPREAERKIRSHISNNTNRTVQLVEVVAVAISPGDKVRNAIGIPGLGSQG